MKNVIPKVKLFLIGNGDKNYIKYLKNFCNKNDLKDCIHFLGFKKPNEIIKYHLISQMFVLPSLNDNSPNSLSEAMVLGMPII